MSEQREAIVAMLDPIVGPAYASNAPEAADVVIQFLWSRADDPATYAEVASKMYRRYDLNTFEMGTAQQYMNMMLETLLGPRPSGEDGD